MRNFIWSRSTRWPIGAREASGATSVITTCPTIPCTIAVTPVLAARIAREVCGLEKMRAPDDGPGSTKQSADCILQHGTAAWFRSPSLRRAGKEPRLDRPSNGRRIQVTVRLKSLTLRRLGLLALLI